MRLKGFEKLTSIDIALSSFLKALRLRRLRCIQCPLHEALGRVLAEDLVAERDLPSFKRSAMDGYAVMAQDVFEASPFKPKILNLTKNREIHEKEVKEIWTGNPLPSGADAVVILEKTKRINDKIEVLAPVTPGENVSKRGEDVKRGEVPIKNGTRLGPPHIGLLAALGVLYVNVVEKAKIAILSTGDELVELGHKPKKGQVIDVNRLILSSLCLELGAEYLDLGCVRDDFNEIKSRIDEGLRHGDLILTTGGTSVGVRDLVPTVINRLGTPGVITHGIAMRPGMPTALAIVHGKPIIVLSGNPVAAMIGFEVFARPIILHLSGAKNETRPVIRAKLTQRVSSVLGRRVFLRVHVFAREDEFLAEPVRVKGSGIITSMIKSNGYVVIPDNREGLEKGESVRVYLFDKIEA